MRSTASIRLNAFSNADVGGGPIGEIERTFPKPITESEEVRFARIMKDYDKNGTGETYTEYPLGWSQATNAQGLGANFRYRRDFIDHFQSYPPPQTIENKAGKEVWELYNVDEDPTELNDLAKSNPAKLKDLLILFDKEARKN